MEISDLRSRLGEGLVIPALPLALDNRRQWDQRHQRAIIRYYLDSGVGGIAVGVHSTQFEIREPEHGLFEPILRFAVEEMNAWKTEKPSVKIAGICGETPQAKGEAEFASANGYDAGLLSMSVFQGADDNRMLAHCRAIAREIPLIGFYLQPAAGGRHLSYEFWRAFADIPEVIAIKIAPFNRYQTFDVVRAVCDSGRNDVALYTGNDDNIIADLLTPWEVDGISRNIVGGLLGQSGVWTQRAVELLEEIKGSRESQSLEPEWLTRNAELTDANAAVFDAANGFAGVLPGIHEVLRRNGLMANRLTLNPDDDLSPGQAEHLDRVEKAYPWITDDAFVRDNLSRWLNS